MPDDRETDTPSTPRKRGEAKLAVGAGVGAGVGLLAMVPMAFVGFITALLAPVFLYKGLERVAEIPPIESAGEAYIEDRDAREIAKKNAFITTCKETYAAEKGWGYDDDPSGWGASPAEVEQACAAAGVTCEADAIMTRAAAQCVFEERLTLEPEIWDPKTFDARGTCKIKDWVLDLAFDPQAGVPRWRFEPVRKHQRDMDERWTYCDRDILFEDIDGVTGKKLKKKGANKLGKRRAEAREAAHRQAARACMDTYPASVTGGLESDATAALVDACEEAGLVCAPEEFMTQQAAACIIRDLFPPTVDCDQSDWTYELEVAAGGKGASRVRWAVTPGRTPIERGGTMYCDEGVVSAALDAATGDLVEHVETNTLDYGALKALYAPNLAPY
ncbi:MAG: hypothetical protein ACON5B_02580 [Myxococcota bacterium]